MVRLIELNERNHIAYGRSFIRFLGFSEDELHVFRTRTTNICLCVLGPHIITHYDEFRGFQSFCNSPKKNWSVSNILVENQNVILKLKQGVQWEI